MHPGLLSVLRSLWSVLRAFLFLVNNIYCIPCHVFIMLATRPLLWARPQLYWRLEGVLFSWLLNMVGMLSYMAKYEIVEMGDSVENLVERRCLLVANHQSTGDVPLLMNAFTAPSYGETANHAMWIMDSMFRWTNFGLVSQLHRDFFIECGRANRDKSVEQLRRALYTHYLNPGRRWLLLFPEGGFLHKRQEASKRFADKNGLPDLKHVTLPRIGAAQAILQTLAPSINNHTELAAKTATAATSIFAKREFSQNSSAVVANGVGSGGNCDTRGGNMAHAAGSCANGVVSSQLEYLIDLTIAYPDQKRPLNLWSIMAASRDRCRIIFHYRVFPISQIPRDKDGLTEWFYQLFYDKERMLSAYYGRKSCGATPGGDICTNRPSTLSNCDETSCDDLLMGDTCCAGNGASASERVKLVDGCGHSGDGSGVSSDGSGSCLKGRGSSSEGRGSCLNGPGRVIRHDPLPWLLRHCFFIVCSYVMLYVLYSICSSFCQIITYIL